MEELDLYYKLSLSVKLYNFISNGRSFSRENNRYNGPNIHLKVSWRPPGEPVNIHLKVFWRSPGEPVNIH